MFGALFIFSLTLFFMLGTASRAFVSSVSKTATSVRASFHPLPVSGILQQPPLPFQLRSFHMSQPSGEQRKAGVSSPEDLKEFVAAAGHRLLVVDVRNPDPEKEPGDQKSLAVAPLPSPPEVRPQAVHLIYDRDTKTMPLPEVAKDTPIITHCGGGGRGQKAKDFLLANGFSNVLNGGGPKEKDCWAEFGDK